MSNLERDLYRSLADVVVKMELELDAIQAITPGRPIPCICDSMSSGPGCKPCLVKRGRKVMAEYEAKPAPVGPPCADCGKPAGENAAMRFGDDTTELVCGPCFAIYQALATLDAEVLS